LYRLGRKTWSRVRRPGSKKPRPFETLASGAIVAPAANDVLGAQPAGTRAVDASHMGVGAAIGTGRWDRLRELWIVARALGFVADWRGHIARRLAVVRVSRAVPGSQPQVRPATPSQPDLRTSAGALAQSGKTCVVQVINSQPYGAVWLQSTIGQEEARETSSCGVV
jgi:hypothetical protein